MKRLRALLTTALFVVFVLSVAATPVGAQEDPREFPETRLIVVIAGGELIGVESDQYVSGQDWVPGDEIQLYLNGSYVATDIAHGNDEGSGSPAFFASELGFTIEAGDQVNLVRVSDGLSYSHTVTDLTVGWASAELDVVAGSAARDSEIHVVAGDAMRSVLADPTTGAWTADFSQPGQQAWETSVFDIDADTVGIAVQIDGANNFAGTFVFWAPTGAPPEPVPESKADCRKGGWRDLARPDGTSFRNQGQCIKYVSTGRSAYADAPPRLAANIVYSDYPGDPGEDQHILANLGADGRGLLRWDNPTHFAQVFAPEYGFLDGQAWLEFDVACLNVVGDSAFVAARTSRAGTDLLAGLLGRWSVMEFIDGGPDGAGDLLVSSQMELTEFQAIAYCEAGSPLAVGDGWWVNPVLEGDIRVIGG